MTSTTKSDVVLMVTSTDPELDVKVSKQAGLAGEDVKLKASDDELHSIDPGREPFLPTPWWAPGHRVRGMDPRKVFVNENAVRARAGLLLVFAFIVILLLTNLENPSTVVPYMAIPILLDFVAGTTVGLTPIAPIGVLGTLLARSQKPIWKPYAPKRFAWFLGILLVATCLTFVLATTPELPGRRYYMVGLASVCVILTFLETSLGFCLGCYMYNKMAIALGWEQCQECTADSLSSDKVSEASASELRSLVHKHDAVVFSKSKCPFCVRAKQGLAANGVSFHTIELDTPEGAKWVPTLLKATGQRTVPYIYLQEDFVGGCTDLEALTASGELKKRFANAV